jgi:hypothetical protein
MPGCRATTSQEKLLEAFRAAGLCASGPAAAALVEDKFEEPVQAFLAIVQTGAEIGRDLVPPAFGGSCASAPN